LITYWLRGSVDDEVMNADCVGCEVCAGCEDGGLVGIEGKAFLLFLFVADGEESLFVPVSVGHQVEQLNVLMFH
jgi:hypothetical protein